MIEHTILKKKIFFQKFLRQGTPPIYVEKTLIVKNQVRKSPITHFFKPLYLENDKRYDANFGFKRVFSLLFTYVQSIKCLSNLKSQFSFLDPKCV